MQVTRTMNIHIVCQVRVMDEDEDSNAGGKQRLKNRLARQGKAGQGTNHIRHITYGNKPSNCKHKEIIKGANEEGNEGRQVGQLNQ